MVNRSKNIGTRLWSRTERLDSGCLVWTGYRGPLGYGEMGDGRKSVRVHRVAYELTYGPIPEGMFVCHRCDNPPCVEPTHLFLGTPKDNVDDMVAKGREARGAMLPHTRLTEAQVAEIRQRYVPRFGPPKRGGRRSNAAELAEEYGVGVTYIRNIAKGWERVNG
jgi:hypothetical protein